MKTSTDTWRLSDASALEIIDSTALGVEERIQPGRHLYRQGERSRHFFLLREGRVRIFMTVRDGAEFLMEIMGPPAILGEGSAFDGLPRFSSAVALDVGTVVRFDSQLVLQALQHRPALAAALLGAASLKQRVLAQRLQELSEPDPARRVHEFLLRLSSVLGTRDGTAWELKLDLSQEDLAGMTGLSRVSVSRALKRLRDEQLIAGGRGGFKIYASAGANGYGGEAGRAAERGSEAR